jgi:hypothetical protein
MRGVVDYVRVSAGVLLLPLADFEFGSAFVEGHGVAKVADSVGGGFAEGEHPGDEADLGGLESQHLFLLGGVERRLCK